VNVPIASRDDDNSSVGGVWGGGGVLLEEKKSRRDEKGGIHTQKKTFEGATDPEGRGKRNPGGKPMFVKGPKVSARAHTKREWFCCKSLEGEKESRSRVNEIEMLLKRRGVKN